MSNRRFTSSHQSVNIARNGNLEFVEALDDGTQMAHFWKTENLVHKEAQGPVVQNTFEVLQGTPAEGVPGNRFRIQLLTNQPATLFQDFRRQGDAHAMDFPVPLGAGIRAAQAAGYLATEVQGLPAYKDYTWALDIRVIQGKATLAVSTWDLQGLRSTPTYLEGVSNLTLKTTGAWRRYALPYSVELGLGLSGFELLRAPGQGLVVVEVGLVCLAFGSYLTLPYTGDLLVASVPKGAILLSLGQVCPPGFADLGEGDLAPLAEWLADEPSALARKGNYPRAGTAQVGTTKHTVTSVDSVPGATDSIEFSGPDSKVADTVDIDSTKSNPAVDVPGGPLGVPDHAHAIEPAGTRPVSRGYLLCRRL